MTAQMQQPGQTLRKSPRQRATRRSEAKADDASILRHRMFVRHAVSRRRSRHWTARGSTLRPAATRRSRPPGLRCPTAPTSTSRLPHACGERRDALELPSGSLLLAATMLGNGSGARGVGSQPFARSTSMRRIAFRQRRFEVRRRRQQRAPDRSRVPLRPMHDDHDARAVRDEDHRRRRSAQACGRALRPTRRTRACPASSAARRPPSAASLRATSANARHVVAQAGDDHHRRRGLLVHGALSLASCRSSSKRAGRPTCSELVFGERKNAALRRRRPYRAGPARA